MSEQRSGYRVEPYAAVEVKVGWTLLYGDEAVVVTDRCKGSPRHPGEDPSLTLFFNRPPYRSTDEAYKTVYRVVEGA